MRSKHLCCLTILTLSLALPLSAHAVSPKIEKAAHEAAVLAERYYRLGKIDAAWEQYEKAYKLIPLPMYLFNIAQCNLERGELDLAVEQFEKYIRENPRANNLGAARARLDLAKQKQRAKEASLHPELDPGVLPPPAPPPPPVTPAPPPPQPAPEKPKPVEPKPVAPKPVAPKPAPVSEPQPASQKADTTAPPQRLIEPAAKLRNPQKNPFAFRKEEQFSIWLVTLQGGGIVSFFHAPRLGACLSPSMDAFQKFNGDDPLYVFSEGLLLCAPGAAIKSIDDTTGTATISADNYFSTRFFGKFGAAFDVGSGWISPGAGIGFNFHVPLQSRGDWHGGLGGVVDLAYYHHLDAGEVIFDVKYLLDTFNDVGRISLGHSVALQVGYSFFLERIY